MHRRPFIAAASIAAAALGGAHAQEVSGPASAFTIDEAARCAAVFAFTLDAMATAQNVPRTTRNMVRDGLVIWEYELSASQPDATQEELSSAANRAIAYVRADLPMGDGPDGAQARGSFLMGSAKGCQDKIDVAYGGAEHPVIPHLRQAEVTVGDPTLPSPARPTPVAATSQDVPAKPKGRQLR